MELFDELRRFDGIRVGGIDWGRGGFDSWNF